MVLLMLSHYVFLLSLHFSMILKLELEMHTEAIKLIDTHGYQSYLNAPTELYLRHLTLDDLRILWIPNRTVFTDHVNELQSVAYSFTHSCHIQYSTCHVDYQTL